MAHYILFAAKKDLTEMEKGVVVTADDQPAVNAKPMKEKKSKRKKEKSQDSMEKLMTEIGQENETEVK